jgi:hypothetical protein
MAISPIEAPSIKKHELIKAPVGKRGPPTVVPKMSLPKEKNLRTELLEGSVVLFTCQTAG